MRRESVVAELFERIPKLRTDYEAHFASMGDATAGEVPGPYEVFGSILLPALDNALILGDLGMILRICAFLEDTAEAARNDAALTTLLRNEVGEWLRGMDNEDRLAPWLGAETKRICRYVPGLATQRRKPKPGKQPALLSRLATWFHRIRRQ